MSNSADNSPSLEPHLDEDSDVIELTEEVGPSAPAVDDLAFAIPEFKVPTGQTSTVMSRDPERGVHEDEAFDREELVRTVRMEAFDRNQLELLDAVRKWSISAYLRDHRFAPDILVTPPRVLTKKWKGELQIPDAAYFGAATPTIQTKTITDEEILRSAEDVDALPEVAREEPQHSDKVPQGAPRAHDIDDASFDDSEEMPEIELDSEILEDATPLPQPPPKPDLPEGHVEQRQRKDTQPLPARRRHPTPVSSALTQSGPDNEDDISGIVQEILDEKKPKYVPNAAELKRANWFVDVFSEAYLRTLPKDLAGQTERESAFIVESLGVKKGARIFDLACGFGRHSINLAKRGYEVAGLDLSMAMLQRALSEAQRQSLSIKFIHGDMRELNFNEIFDACFLWQTSFGYFDDRTNFKVLQGIHRSLKPGGRLLIDVVNRDYVIAEMPSRTWWEGMECVLLEEVEFDYETSILHTKRSFIYEDGSPPQEFNGYIRLYSLHELNQILSVAGFDLLEVSGELCHRGSFLGTNSHRMILLVEKR